LPRPPQLRGAAAGAGAGRVQRRLRSAAGGAAADVAGGGGAAAETPATWWMVFSGYRLSRKNLGKSCGNPMDIGNYSGIFLWDILNF